MSETRFPGEVDQLDAQSVWQPWSEPSRARGVEDHRLEGCGLQHVTAVQLAGPDGQVL
ncbi:MAG: hypothetical protein WKF78_04030 [Candidatus Limnocylindrales bacterium]